MPHGAGGQHGPRAVVRWNAVAARRLNGYNWEPTRMLPAISVPFLFFLFLPHPTPHPLVGPATGPPPL